MGSGAPGPQVGARQQELAQIQEKKERRNQKESEKASSTWLHLLAASARPRSPSSVRDLACETGARSGVRAPCAWTTGYGAATRAAELTSTGAVALVAMVLLAAAFGST